MCRTKIGYDEYKLHEAATYWECCRLGERGEKAAAEGLVLVLAIFTRL